MSTRVEVNGDGYGYHIEQQANEVEHPSHYTSLGAKCTKCEHPIECIDVVVHLPFSRGSAIKYIWRAGLKGDAVRDIEKAIQHLKFERERLLSGRPQ